MLDLKLADDLNLAKELHIGNKGIKAKSLSISGDVIVNPNIVNNNYFSENRKLESHDTLNPSQRKVLKFIYTRNQAKTFPTYFGICKSEIDKHLDEDTLAELDSLQQNGYVKAKNVTSLLGNHYELTSKALQYLKS